MIAYAEQRWGREMSIPTAVIMVFIIRAVK